MLVIFMAQTRARHLRTLRASLKMFASADVPRLSGLKRARYVRTWRRALLSLTERGVDYMQPTTRTMCSYLTASPMLHTERSARYSPAGSQRLAQIALP